MHIRFAASGLFRQSESGIFRGSLKAVWDDTGNPCWTYETDIPHETFEIYEDGELFCIGIVFSTKDLM